MRRLLLALAALVLTATGCGSGAGTVADPATDPQAVKLGDTIPLRDLIARTHETMKAQRSVVMTYESSDGTNSSVLELDTSTGNSRIRLADHAILLMVDGDLYNQAPHVPAGGKKWVKTTLGSRAAADAYSDPLSVFGHVDATARVTSITNGTTYRVSVTATQLKAALAEMDPSFTSSTASDVSLTMVYDAGGLPRTVTLTGSRPGEGVGVVTFSQWGLPLSLKAPPANEVATFDAFAPGGETASTAPSVQPSVQPSAQPSACPLGATGSSNAVPGTNPCNPVTATGD